MKMGTDVAGILWDGPGSRENPAGMEFIYAGAPRKCSRNLADDKNPLASVRILSKLSGEMC